MEDGDSLHPFTQQDGFYAEFDRFLRGTVARFNRECRRTIPPDARDDLLEAGLARIREAPDVMVRDLAYNLLDGASEGEYLRDRVYDYLDHFVASEESEYLVGSDVVDEEALREVEEAVLDEAWRALVRFGMDRLGITPAPMGWKPEDGEPELPSQRKEIDDSHSDQEDDVGGDAHEAFEDQQYMKLKGILGRALAGRRTGVKMDEDARRARGHFYGTLSRQDADDLAASVVEELGVDFAWGLIGRCYADEGLQEQLYAHLERMCRDFDRMLQGAHGTEAAETVRNVAGIALRRFIVEHDLPRGDRPPAEVKEVEEPQEPERSRHPDSPESAAELGEAAVETAEKVADEHLSGRPGLEPLDSVAKTSCVHHPDSEAVVQSAESGQPLCRPCARLVSASVETETVTELEGRYRACMADHPSVADVSCQRPAGHEGKHHAENGVMGHTWPQEKRYGHGPDEDVPPPEPPSQNRTGIREGPCYDLDLDPDGILAEQLDTEVYRIRADNFWLTDEFYDFQLDGDRVGCFPRDAVLAVRKVQE